jgi:choline dehydrogenase
MPLSVHGTERWNVAFAYLEPARERANLSVLGDALVERVLFDGDRATGVRAIVDGRPADFRAAAVVRCGGAYGSPAVLLRSGVGPGAELEAHGIDARSELPVGEQLAEHFGVRIRLEPSDALDRHFSGHDLFLAQGMVFARRPSAADWDLHLLPMLVPVGAGRVEGPAQKPYSLGLTAMLIQPAWRGTLTLASADPSQIPVVTQVAFARADLDAAVEALELARTLLGTAAGAAAVERELVPGPEAPSGDGARQFLAAATPSRYFHPTGTCALGSVVDDNARVLGFENLYVADASIIPHPVRAGTNFTVMALAEHVAELLSRPPAP